MALSFERHGLSEVRLMLSVWIVLLTLLELLDQIKLLAFYVKMGHLILMALFSCGRVGGLE